MKRIRIIADKAADTSLVLLAGAHLMVLAVFLATLIAATSQARGDEMPECKGQDIVAELARDDPALLRTIKAEAAETQNGQGLLWKIEKDGMVPSFLFGTMHMTDPRVTELTPEAHGAFEASSTVVIETTDVLDETKAMAAMLAKPELMLFTDGTKWPSLLSNEDRALATKALAERGIPIQTVQTMKPWILSAMVALPACEIARKTGGAPVLDIKLAQDAEANGKAVAGLETVGEQLEAMASLPLEFHLEGLVETLRLGDRIDDVIETMIVLYEHADTGTLWPLFRAVLPPSDGGESYAAFEKAMITSRNAVMAERALPMIEKGSAFIAVGALHLPGPDGLVEKFRDNGFTVTRAD